jgi:hypothetical protein
VLLTSFRAGCCCCALLMGAACGVAQQTVAVSNAQEQTVGAPEQSAAKPSGGAWDGPWTHGSVTMGYTYLWADQGKGERVNLSGWFAKPQINIGRGWSAFADFTNYYGQNSKGPLNSHGFTFGGQKNFFKTVKLGLFAEAGDLRTSNVTVTNSFLFNVGENVSIPLYRHLSLAITPAEYVMIKPPNGQPIRNDFNAKVGFSIPF